jgi:phenylalanyl-tRNA synthetase beta chain
MRFSLNFVREFLKVDLAPEELASLLTMSGMEVEHFEKIGDDWAFDIEVTSNRYDWLSIIGIAREIAACLHKKLKVSYPGVIKTPLLTEREIIIEDYKDCPFYVARTISQVKVKESSLELRQRILNCGLNSVNNIVDITNYCMLKWGNPLHAFDQDKLEGNIYIRRAASGERFIGIDNKERQLQPQNLVIADEKKVIALAGVMGAKNSEVGVNTKNIFLEAAVFSPVTVRRSRKIAALDTDSSYRFERKVFTDYLEFASQEAAVLIAQQASANYCGYKAAGKKPAAPKKKISLSLNHLNAYLGGNFAKVKVKTVLQNLDFKVTEAARDKIAVSPPPYRLDIEGQVDIYEEFIRIYGYDKIKPSLPFLTTQTSSTDSYKLKAKLRSLCSRLGLKEVITYSIESAKELAILGEENLIRLTNPLREQENTLRSALLLGMIKCAQYNLNHGQDNLRFFEIANIYYKHKDNFCEVPKIAYGSSGGQEEFFYLKAVTDEILKYFNLGGYYFKEKQIKNFTNALGAYLGEEEVGFLGKLDARLKAGFDLRKDLFFGQIDILSLQKNKKEKQYKNFSSYPAVYRDLSLILDKGVKFLIVEELIRNKGNYVSNLSIIDIYKGKTLSRSQQAFTLRIYYRSREKTLTAQEVDATHNSIRLALARVPGVTLR